MPAIEQFDFVSLQFDAKGALQGKLDELQQHAGTATDVIVMAHGFRNSADYATGLYTRFLHNFRVHLGRAEFHSIAQRKYAVAGVYWPSLEFRESFPAQAGVVQAVGDLDAQAAAVEEQLEQLKAEVTMEQCVKLEQAKQLLPALEGDADAQNQFTRLVLSVLERPELGAGEGLDEVLSQDGQKVLAKLRMPITVSTRFAPREADSTGTVASEEFSAASLGTFFDTILGAAGRLLNQTTWWLMKERSGIVGAKGTARAIRDLKAKHAGIRVHLVGHSLGGRLIAACAKSLTNEPMLQPDSVTLLEAAFSHYGFSTDAGDRQEGFFRDVIRKQVVRGPLVATFSAMDTVVGHIYALASRVADDNLKALGDANDRFGGIGRNGAQKTKESVSEPLHDVGIPYAYQTGVVNNLDGSANLITDHSDVTNERVTYAFASAVAIT